MVKQLYIYIKKGEEEVADVEEWFLSLHIKEERVGEQGYFCLTANGKKDGKMKGRKKKKTEVGN